VGLLRDSLLFFAAVGIAPGCLQEGRLPIPGAAEQRRAEKIVRDVFRSEYASKEPAARSALAEKLLKEAGGTQDPVIVFVLLREARDMAAEAGKLETALECVDRVAEKFDVKAGDLKAAVLAAVRKKAASADDWARLAEAWLGLAGDLARKEGDFDAALKASREAESAAKSARDGSAALRAGLLSREIPEMKRLFEQSVKAERILSENPADPEACLARGRYLCLCRGDWAVGLAFLAKGADPALANAAARDLSEPEDAAGQVEVADQWFALGEKGRSPLETRGWKSRARMWYERASVGAPVLLRMRVEKRLSELEASAGPSAAGGPVDLLCLIDPAKDARSGTWSFSGKVLVASPPAPAVLGIPYAPPEEYDLGLVVEKKGPLLFYIGLGAGGHAVPVYLDCMQSTVSCIGPFGAGIPGDEGTKFSGEVLSPTGPSTVVCAVRKKGIEVTVGGKRILRYGGDFGKIPPDLEGFRTTDPKALGIGSNCTYHIHKVVLTPVSGRGRRLR